MCEECVRVGEGVCVSVWKYSHWVSQFEYMLWDIRYVEFGPKFTKIDQSVWKVCEECVRVCEGVSEIAYWHRLSLRYEYG